MAGKIEIGMNKMEDIRQAAIDFKDSVAKNLKDMHVEVKDWRFGTESHEDGITIDVSVKLLIKPKTSK
jgi:tRNA U34 5-carboxymethylaminomethyl modifying enzyme MnmG/GidA